MSVAGISGSSLFNYENQTIQNRFQQFRQEFQQLGQDLQSGNLSAAQQDFATLQQLGPQTSSTQSAQSNNPIVQAFQQLAQDLQSGNLSAAQQDYTQIQQDFQNQAAVQNQTTEGHHGHHHHHGGGGESSEISQLFSQLGQALQSGNLSTAQQTYNTLLQDLQQFSAASGQTATQQSSQSSSNSLSVSA
jgi:outer membrane protein assembly factor BamD (BamD/ComL family)